MTATHGWWCNSVAWPTKCPGCSSPVFFFRCDCGSKVFFDELGDPWPIHDCDTSWTRNLVRNKDGNGGTTVEISNGVSITRPAESFRVELGVIEKGRRQSETEDPIIAVSPEGADGLVTVIGILREKHPKINLHKALKVPETTLGKSALGPLGSGEWGKITIHEPSSSKNILHSYTIFVEKTYIVAAENSKGVTIAADIRPHAVLGSQTVWVCEKYEVWG